jgi:hypothetical protein
MDGKIEQHVRLKFCLKLSKSATETLEMLYEARPHIPENTRVCG